MAADIDLLGVSPHQVSRDMRGYSVFFYGEPKSGKTTIASRFPKHLILAFEKGYSAIPQSCRVGPEGGQILVERTLQSLQGLFHE